MKNAKYLLMAVLMLASAAVYGCTSEITVNPPAGSGDSVVAPEIPAEQDAPGTAVEPPATETETEAGIPEAVPETDEKASEGENTATETEKEPSDAKAEVDEKVLLSEDSGSIGYSCEADDGTIYFLKVSEKNYEEGGIFFNIPTNEGSTADIVSLDKDGNEKNVLTTKSIEPFAMNGDSIFFNDGDGLYRTTLAGENRKMIAEGELADITADGDYVVITKDLNIYTVSTADNSVVTIAKNASYLDTHDGVIYYSLYEDSKDALHGKVTVARSDTNGKNNKILCITEPNMFTEYEFTGGSNAHVAHIHFDDEYIYFSYGTVAGSANGYHGGMIAKVKYDGSGLETVMGTPDDMVDAEFYVENGKVIMSDAPTGVYFRNLNQYMETEDHICLYEQPSGTPVPVIEKAKYIDKDFEMCDFANVSTTENYVSFIVNCGTYNEEKCIGWRDYYDRDLSKFFIIDRDSGAILYTYSY